MGRKRIFIDIAGKVKIRLKLEKLNFTIIQFLKCRYIYVPLRPQAFIALLTYYESSYF